MSKHRDLNAGDVFPASWSDALQEFIGTLAANFILTQASTTQLQVLAGTGSGQVGIGIGGLWRYRSTSIFATHPGGAAGTHPVWVTASANVFSNSPSPDTDTTDYNFYLAITTGATPTGNTVAGFPIVATRQVGWAVWSGSAISGLLPMVGTPDVGTLFMAGDLKATARSSAPLGWQLCDGSVVQRFVYPNLFAAIGTTYNTGGEAGTDFRIPDLRGRVPVGVDGSAGRIASNDALGQSGGVATVTLASTQSGMPDHAHHMVAANLGGAPPGVISSGGKNYIQGAGTGGGKAAALQQIVVDGSFLYGLGVGSAVGGAQTAAAAHENMPPYQVVNWLIKY